MAKRSDGIFVFVVLALAAFAAEMAGLGGMGTQAYSPFSPLLMLGTGAMCYFVVKDAGAFGVKDDESAFAYAGVALAAAAVFSALLLGSTAAVLGTAAALVAIACAAVLVALIVRARAAGQKGQKPAEEAGEAAVPI